MIGYIHGKVLDTNGKKALILTDSGVGYEINYGYFLEPQITVELFIHHHISENDQSLWGFNTLIDKKMFELLKTVNKVGSSKAYPLISTVGTESVIQAIMLDRPNILSQAPGIGKKMAEQIILSLKDKVESFQTGNNLSKNSQVSSTQMEMNEVDKNLFNDALLALESLGYDDSKITKLVQKQVMQGVSTSEAVIKNVLREL